MLMASSPSRVEGLQASPVEGGGMALSWQPAVEHEGPRLPGALDTPAAGGAERSLVVTTPSAKVPAPAAGSAIAVRALGRQRHRGLGLDAPSRCPARPARAGAG